MTPEGDRRSAAADAGRRAVIPDAIYSNSLSDTDCRCSYFGSITALRTALVYRSYKQSGMPIWSRARKYGLDRGGGRSGRVGGVKWSFVFLSRRAPQRPGPARPGRHGLLT